MDRAALVDSDRKDGAGRDPVISSPMILSSGRRRDDARQGILSHRYRTGSVTVLLDVSPWVTITLASPDGKSAGVCTLT